MSNHVAQYVHLTDEVEESGAMVWSIAVEVSIDLDERFRCMNAPVPHEALEQLAARAVHLVDHFEHDFDYVDFYVTPNPTGESVAVRVQLQRDTLPRVRLMLSPPAVFQCAAPACRDKARQGRPSPISPMEVI